MGLGFVDIRRQVDLAAEFDFLSRARKFAAISDAGGHQETATRFIRQSAIADSPRASSGPIKSAAAVMRQCAKFSAPVGIPAFSGQKGVDFLCIGLLRPRWTIAHYIARAVNAALHPGLHTDWIPPSVLPSTRSLKNPRDLPIRLRDFTFAFDLPWLMTAVSLRGEFRAGRLSPLL